MAVRRLYEPLCIAFGTTVSSPTVPTYQLYDLPHKFTPRLYMESEDPNLVLREIGVWAGWEQAGSANTRSFLLDLLKDEEEQAAAEKAAWLSHQNAVAQSVTKRLAELDTVRAEAEVETDLVRKAQLLARRGNVAPM